ncbi:hypothetical protein, partial [Chitinivibrio alkaliphilus]|uniref:hypothetical protein n=1 Tax=Chitinivibrio alkaliphilus TaxID=1505232 RepID=UPI0005546B79
MTLQGTLYFYGISGAAALGLTITFFLKVLAMKTTYSVFLCMFLCILAAFVSCAQKDDLDIIFGSQVRYPVFISIDENETPRGEINAEPEGATGDSGGVLF